MNVCARRAQRPSLLGLCRAAAKGLLKTNIFVQCFFCHQWITAVQYDCVARGDARKPFLRARVYAKNTPKNYTHPALIDLIAWYLVRLIVYSLCSQPSTSDGLTRHGMPVLSARHFSFPQDSFCFPQDGFSFPQDSFCFPQDGFYFPQDNFYFPQGSFYYLRRKSLLQTL